MLYHKWSREHKWGKLCHLCHCLIYLKDCETFRSIWCFVDSSVIIWSNIQTWWFKKCSVFIYNKCDSHSLVTHSSVDRSGLTCKVQSCWDLRIEPHLWQHTDGLTEASPRTEIMKPEVLWWRVDECIKRVREKESGEEVDCDKNCLFFPTSSSKRM